MKKIEKKQLIVIIVSIIIGISAVTVINLNSSAVKIAFTEPQPTQQDYDILKGYALDIAKGENFNKAEDIEVNKEIQGKNLKIKIETPEMYGVEASFPLSEIKNLEIVNASIEYKAIIDYDNVIYSEYTLIKDKITFIVMDLLMILITAGAIYMLSYWFPKEWKQINRKIAK